MTKKKNYPQGKSVYPQKIKRTFSTELKRKKVKEIEQGLISVTQLSRSLEVTRTSIYKWIRKYSLTYEKPIHTIVESKSESKKVLQLKNRISELEQLIGRKQIQLDFTEKMLELASEDLKIDIKKKYGTGRSYGTGNVKKKTDLG